MDGLGKGGVGGAIHRALSEVILWEVVGVEVEVSDRCRGGCGGAGGDVEGRFCAFVFVVMVVLFGGG